MGRAQSQQVERLAADVDEVLHVPDEAPAADTAEAQVSVFGRMRFKVGKYRGSLIELSYTVQSTKPT